MPTLYIADAERDADMKNLSRKEAAKVLEDMKSKGEIPKAAVTQWKRNTALDMAIEALKYSEVPNSSDCISRQAAINAIDECYCGGEDSCGEPWIYKENAVEAIQMIEPIPSAQPQRTCVNCGRTANNGGWYADGRTRCPIEEHYALPKDGYCHLWEKRNVTDDDYPERRTDG